MCSRNMKGHHKKGSGGNNRNNDAENEVGRCDDPSCTKQGQAVGSQEIGE